MRNLIWFLTLSLSFACTLTAVDFSGGVEAYNKGDYTGAAKEWRPLAEKGDPLAQFNLGLLYLDGKGVPQDYQKAETWFTRAAEQDFAKAQLNLGAMLGVGQGTKRDYVQAYKWLNICAAKGNVKCEAQRDLVAKKLSAAKLANAQHLASSWKPKLESEPDKDVQK